MNTEISVSQLSPIVIVNYGMGNVGSVMNMIRHIAGEAYLSSSPDEIANAKKLILPGVGAFDAGVLALRESGLDHAIRHAVKEKGAILLGICLGMQLLMEYSEEGSLSGLELIPGRVIRFRFKDASLPVPQMGWNTVHPVRQSALLTTNSEEQRFYFVHSYYVECADSKDVSGVTTYGIDYTSILERDCIFGTQFHPEKSHRFGMNLMKRFVDL